MIDVPVSVKKALKDGRMTKNYRINVLNDDGTVDFTINNSTLVSESVKIDERMCSGSLLKFGLCEGSSLEFQYFDHDNIRGRQLQVFIDVEYGESTPYAIPMGFFTVKSCSMQFSTGIYKATAYNKLQSDYLDAKANQMLLDDFDGDGTQVLTLYDIQRHLLQNYEIVERPSTYVPVPLTEKSSAEIQWAKIGAFSALKGIDTPLSAYVYGGDRYNVYIYMDCAAFSGSPQADQYWELAWMKGDIEVFLENFVNYAVDILEGALFYLDYSEQRYWTREGLTNFVKNYFDPIFKIRVDNKDYTLMRNPKEQLEKINNLIHKGQNYVEVTIPLHMGFYFPYDDPPSRTQLVNFTTSYNYSYRDTDDTIVTKTNTPDIRFSDGTGYSIHANMFSFKILDISDAEKIPFTIESMPEFTLRDIMSANYETVCQYGQLDREADLFSGVELNGGGLYPSETLYPADSLYPNNGTGGQGFHPYPSEYSKLWTDTQGEQSFRYLIITYKGLDENDQEVEKTLQRTVNADGTTDYNMSDNWLFRNLVWTDADVGDYADAMVTKMQNIRWFPFEMWAAGLPYVETGDAIEITDRNGGSHVSYVLQRQLKGIQNLQDTYINGELDIF